ncbi:MAG: DUF4446 family protein [Chloroflexi bacterium]|nr:DUF4446 family protein [Chloroflexota bacterium]
MEIIVVVVLLILILIVAGWVASMELRYQRLARSFRLLMTGRRGADLEAVLLNYVSRMERIERDTRAMQERANELDGRWPFLVQHVGVVRFNPFADKGGDQSFVVAVLNDHADGVVLTGLHSRNDSRVYAKPVVAGQSTYTLTGEEKEAIARAMAPAVQG